MESGLFFFVTIETLHQWKEQQLLPEWGLPRQGDRARFSFEFYLEGETSSHQAEKGGRMFQLEETEIANVQDVLGKP